MSQKIEINSKAVWTLDCLVCFASAAIGAFWGMLQYNYYGALAGGVGGIAVAVIWCLILHIMISGGWHWLAVFVFAACLGGMVGMIDGAVLHWICWTERASDFAPRSLAQGINTGIIFGLVSGLINGGFWGIFYSYHANKNAKLKGACHVG